MVPNRLLLAAYLMASAAAHAGDRKADEATSALLRRPEIEDIQISPDGKLLAIARRGQASTLVSIVRRDDHSIVRSVDPGRAGEISDMRWLDATRLMVAAAVSDRDFGTPLYDPALAIVHADGKPVESLPANFLATIDGDPDHLLVTNCARGEKRFCLQEVRKVELGKLARQGDLVVVAPDVHCTLLADRKGNVRFAISAEDDGSSRTYVHRDGQDGWTMINDSAKTGLRMYPILVTADGQAAYVQSERHGGTDVIERYELATGKRTEVYRHPGSDPVRYVLSLDGRELLGAVYQPTDPEMHLWKSEHPDAAMFEGLQEAFAGRRTLVTSAAADGSAMVVHADSDRDPGAYYLFERDLKKATRLGRRFPWITPESSGSQQAFAFKARDGLQLHGLLTLPPGKQGDAAKGLPLVVMPHGGPFGSGDEWGFDTNAQILARHGYAVLQVNFRGSSYYGVDFHDAGARQWGRSMQDDVTDATRWAIQQGVAAPDRVCIFGISYGGYAALMGAIREPALYRCAVGRSGVYDLAKLYRWGDIRRSDYGQAYLRWAIGEDPAELAANSPVTQVGAVKIPVLLGHGILDDRADVKHARALASALERNGKTVELVEYGRMGHSMLLDEQREDFAARLLEFLDRYIGTGAVAAH